MKRVSISFQFCLQQKSPTLSTQKVATALVKILPWDTCRVLRLLAIDHTYTLSLCTRQAIAWYASHFELPIAQRKRPWRMAQYFDLTAQNTTRMSFKQSLTKSLPRTFANDWGYLSGNMQHAKVFGWSLMRIGGEKSHEVITESPLARSGFLLLVRCARSKRF